MAYFPGPPSYYDDDACVRLYDAIRYCAINSASKAEINHLPAWLADYGVKKLVVSSDPARRSYRFTLDFGNHWLLDFTVGFRYLNSIAIEIGGIPVRIGETVYGYLRQELSRYMSGAKGYALPTSYDPPHPLAYLPPTSPTMPIPPMPVPKYTLPDSVFQDYSYGYASAPPPALSKPAAQSKPAAKPVVKPAAPAIRSSTSRRLVIKVSKEPAASGEGSTQGDPANTSPESA